MFSSASHTANDRELGGMLGPHSGGEAPAQLKSNPETRRNLLR